LSPHVSFLRIQTVDGYTCAVFKDNDSKNVYSIRIVDLAIIKAETPYDGFIPLPIFQVLGGDGNSSSWIDFYNPVLGAVDPSKFAVPAGTCIDISNWASSSIQDSMLPQLFVAKSLANDLNPMGFLADVVKESLKRSEPKALVKRQSPPQLAQAFTADITLTINATATPPFKPYMITGKVAFDFVNFGAYVMWDNINGAIPFVLQGGLIIHPSTNGIEWLIASPEGKCWSLLYLQWLWTFLLPPYQIPPDASFTGEAVINGDKCSIWNYYWGGRSITVFVRESDGAIVKGLHFEDPTWTHQGANWILSNIKLSVDPSIYARPAECAETMTWNPSFSSHLPWYWCVPFCAFAEPLQDALRDVAVKLLN